jgi:uncharacterized protein YndB with AHSA1/START domain
MAQIHDRALPAEGVTNLTAPIILHEQPGGGPFAGTHFTQRNGDATMTKPVIHRRFSIERVYKAVPARVFNAFADPAIRRRWFAEDEDRTAERFDTDFRVGGHERSEFRFKDGPSVTNNTVYLDIVPNRRIVIAYAMTVAGTPLSASLATIEFDPNGEGTKLTYTEQIACLDGNDQTADRKTGCARLYETLETELASQQKAA